MRSCCSASRCAAGSPDTSLAYRRRSCHGGLRTAVQLQPGGARLEPKRSIVGVRWPRQQAGNEIRLALCPGAPREFLNLRDPISAEQEARDRMVGFIERLLTD